MRSIIYFLITGIMFYSCFPDKDEDQATNTWKSLIGSNELQGWKMQGDVIANVEDGILTLNSEQGGWLLYDNEYEDFMLETEFLIGKDQNSGIAFRYIDDKKGDPTYTGYTVNLDYNQDQQNILGSIVDVSRAKWLKSTRTDDWNKITIEAVGDHLKVLINDTLVTETHNRRSEEGMIGLQASEETQQVQFRNLRIKALQEEDYLGPQIEDYMRNSKKAKLKSLINGTLDGWSEVGDASWEIKDGIIHGYSNEKGGFLVHKDIYQNFYLKFKFKIIHEDNSGIFIRHTPEDSVSVTTDNAIECNIYDHDGFMHEFSTGAIVPYSRAWSNMIDYEDWNDMEIFAFDGHICMYANGIKSSEAHIPENFVKSGNICIQGGIQVFNNNLPSDIYIRDMYVKNFDDIPFLGY